MKNKINQNKNENFFVIIHVDEVNTLILEKLYVSGHADDVASVV
jgi:hypothetical protein